MSTRIWIAAALAVGALTGAACGDAATAGGGGAGEDEYVITASTSTDFEVNSLEVPAGEVTVTFDNQETGVPHNVHFQGIAGDPKTEVITGPATADVTFTAQAGEYEYICDVHPNMIGTLTVTG